MNRLKQLGKDSLIYGLGGVLAKSIGFFLLPVYTRIFDPADYGTIEMLSVIVGLFSAVLAMGMDSTQSFYFHKQKQRGQKEQARVVSAILQWRLVWGSVLVAAATLGAPILNAVFFGGKLGLAYFGVALRRPFRSGDESKRGVVSFALPPLGFHLDNIGTISSGGGLDSVFRTCLRSRNSRLLSRFCHGVTGGGYHRLDLHSDIH